MNAEERYTIEAITELPSRGYRPQDCCNLATQIRVLLEQKGLQKRYPHILLYGNWSAHHQLEHGAKIVLEKSDSAIAMIEKGSTQLQSETKILIDAFSTTEFAHEAIDFLQSTKIWPGFLMERPSTNLFMRGLFTRFSERPLIRDDKQILKIAEAKNITGKVAHITRQLTVEKSLDGNDLFNFSFVFARMDCGPGPSLRILLPMRLT